MLTFNGFKNNVKFIASKFPYAMAAVAIGGFLIGRFFEAIIRMLGY